MPASPLVSVVIPTKDRNVEVRRAISSALRQTVSDLEIIVVDDGSADPAEAVVAPFFADARLRFHRNDSATGPSLARNVGTGLARGSFVAFLDSDDEWHPTKIEQQMNALQRRDRNAGLSLCGYEVVSGSRRRARVPHEVRAGDVVDLLDTRHEPIVTSCFVLPTTLARNFSLRRSARGLRRSRRRGTHLDLTRRRDHPFDPRPEVREWRAAVLGSAHHRCAPDSPRQARVRAP